MAEKTVTVKIEDLPKVKALLDEARRQIEWHTKIRFDIEAVLDEVLGTEEKDGAGQGIVADVRLALTKVRSEGVQAGREAAAADIEQAAQYDEFCGPWCNGNRGLCQKVANRAAWIARGDNQEER